MKIWNDLSVLSLLIFILVLIDGWRWCSADDPVAAKPVTRNHAAHHRGMVDSNPKDKRAVRISVEQDGKQTTRWMIPYVDRIPGTDVSFKMVPVPGGDSTLGSPISDRGRGEHEVLQRRVKIAPMWVGQMEVTRAEYAEYEKLYRTLKEVDRITKKLDDLNTLDADVVSAPTEIYDPLVVTEYSPTARHPAVSMSHYAAQQYTKWLSFLTERQYRLPTEAEWEYACRGNRNVMFAWGNDIAAAEEHAWYYDNTPSTSHQVGGGMQPNAFGLYDMHGNVAEWVIALDRHDLGINADASLKDIIPEPDLQPEYGLQIAKGGYFDSDLFGLRTAARLFSSDDWLDEDADFPPSPWWLTTDPARSVGFRIVRSLDPLSNEQIRRFWQPHNERLQSAIESKIMEGRGAIGHIPRPDTPPRPNRSRKGS